MKKFNLEDFLKDLKIFISFKTITNKNTEEFEKLFSWVKNFFNGFEVEFEDFEQNGVKSLLIKPKNSRKPKVLGLGHVDVVPASDEIFNIHEKEGWVFGRGVSDMKTQDLVMLWVLRSFLTENSEGRNFWIALTGDEEVGGFSGAKVVIESFEKRNLLPEIAIVPDGGPNFSFVEKEKGVAFFKAIATGISCHGSRPFLGENAISKILNFISELQKKFPNPKNNEDWGISISPTFISGGTAMNQIPDFCEAKFDCRITEKESSEEFLKDLQVFADKFNIKIEPIVTGESFYSPKEGDVAKSFIKILEEVSGKSVHIEHGFGASDGRFLMGKNISVLMTEHNALGLHQENERCEVRSIEELYDIIRKLILEV
ncbi:MAG: succinyl-diaminopimelate desuccinylase [Patescibacteria group bacterium]